MFPRCSHPKTGPHLVCASACLTRTDWHRFNETRGFPDVLGFFPRPQRPRPLHLPRLPFPRGLETSVTLPNPSSTLVLTMQGYCISNNAVPRARVRGDNSKDPAGPRRRKKNPTRKRMSAAYNMCLGPSCRLKGLVRLDSCQASLTSVSSILLRACFDVQNTST